MYTAILPILNDESTVGVTLHKIDDGIDTGDIVCQKLFHLSEHITARELYAQYEEKASILFQETFYNLLTENYDLIKQDDTLSSYFSKKSLDFRDLEIDLRWSATKIYQFVRAFHFPEYQLPKLNGRSVWRCNIMFLPVSIEKSIKLSESNYSSIYSSGDGKLLEIIWA